MPGLLLLQADFQEHQHKSQILPSFQNLHNTQVEKKTKTHHTQKNTNEKKQPPSTCSELILCPKPKKNKEEKKSITLSSARNKRPQLELSQSIQTPHGIKRIILEDL